MNWRLKKNIDVVQVWGKCPEKGDMKWECSENEKGKEKINKWWKDLGKTERDNILTQ